VFGPFRAQILIIFRHCRVMATFSFLRGQHFELPAELRRGTKAYDLAAALPLIIWYGFSAVTLAKLLPKELASLDLTARRFDVAIKLASDAGILLLAGMFICFLFARSPAKASARGLMPRVAAVLGTYLSVGILLLPKNHNPLWLTALSVTCVFAGVSFSIYSLSFLNRSFSIVAEARTLVTSGPYAFVRHPLYAGEELAILGAALQILSPLVVALLVFQVLCQIYRMSREEGVLAEAFVDYSVYKARTARLIP
jgi:protein-S-isoprenylcysteine O-methyltransferase Ste14